jgi:hypothetical protein
MFQMLSNRNKSSDEPVHPSHRLEPQLLDGFVDIHKLANEYLRSQFGQELVGDLVPVVSSLLIHALVITLILIFHAVVDDNNKQLLRSPYASHG